MVPAFPTAKTSEGELPQAVESHCVLPLLIELQLLPS
jgi:hypothetical protein